MDEKILLWIVVGLGAVLLGVFVLLAVAPNKGDKVPAQEAVTSIQDNTSPAEPLEQESASPIVKEEIPSSEAAVTELVEPLEQETASPITKEEIPSSKPAVTEKQAELSEAQRKSIYYEIWELVRKARAQAEAAYPLPHPSDPGYTQEAFLEQSDKQFELQMRLEKQYLEELAARVGITYQDVRDLDVEGYEKSWPMPPFPD